MNETVDSYIASLHSLVKTCRFGSLEEEMIRDRIVLGIATITQERKSYKK